MQEMWVLSLGQKGPLEKEMTTHPDILAWGNPINRGAWRAIVHGIAKSAMTEPLTHTHTHVHTPDDEMFLFIFNNAFCLKVDFV